MIQFQATLLTKHYGKNRVFSGRSFASTDSVIGISGPNGSGKSTLLKCLSGLIKPTSGTIEWNMNSQPVPMKTLKSHIGFVAPYIQLYEELTILENLYFIMKLRNMTVHKEPEELLATLDASEFAGSLFGSLSTGQQQRAKLAAALIHRPGILFMDEPGTNLDKKGKKNIEEIVSRFRNNHAMILLASNQKQELDLCDQIIEL